jgi:hypothetical protein
MSAVALIDAARTLVGDDECLLVMGESSGTRNRRFVRGDSTDASGAVRLSRADSTTIKWRPGESGCGQGNPARERG